MEGVTMNGYVLVAFLLFSLPWRHRISAPARCKGCQENGTREAESEADTCGCWARHCRNAMDGTEPEIIPGARR